LSHKKVNKKERQFERPERSFICRARAFVAKSLVLGLLLASAVSHAAWYDTNWAARQQITISSTVADADLTNYPYLVKIVDPANEVFADAQASGNDILFTSSDGATKLPHEIEFYDAATNTLYAWVQVPLISSTVDTTLYMYYDYGSASNQQNITGTWDSDYVMVQHLQETSGTHLDSTLYNNDGSPQNGVTQNATGQIDGADQFNGSSHYVSVPDDVNLRVVEMTVEAWVYVPSSIPSSYHSIVNHAPSSSNWYGLWNNSNRFHFRWSNETVRRTDFTATFSPDQWYYVAGVLDVTNDQAITYQNETTDTVVNGPDLPTPTSGPTYIGTTFSGSERFKGFIDEVRVSKVARSPAWIKASFRNQSAPDSYQTVGPEQNIDCPGGVVTTTSDALIAGSLRSCVIWANTNAGADTITVPAGTYTLTIPGAGEDASAQGDLDVTEALTINGAGASSTTIDANSLDRVFEILNNATVTLDGLTMTGGANVISGGGISLSTGNTLTVANSVLTGNDASQGGAIYNNRSLILDRVSVTSNTGNSGGGLFNSNSAIVTDSLFYDNTAANDGGGIWTSGPSTSLTLTNSTLSGNQADNGGGLFGGQLATLQNVTIIGNTANTGGGIHQPNGSITNNLRNTIVANNSGGNCNKALTTSAGYNLESPTNTCGFTGTGDQNGVTAGNLNIGALADNGGPTQTHALLAGSFAIDAGTTTGALATDQRGIARGYDGDGTPNSPVTGDYDIGAYESGLAADTCPTVTTTADSGPGSLRQCINYANSNPGTTISFNVPLPANQSSGGDSWWRISLVTTLPAITANGTVIDGTTQTTNQGDSNSLGPEVEIRGLPTSFIYGLGLTSANNSVNGLTINGFSGTLSAGIRISGASATGNTVTGNYLGTDYSGTVSVANYIGVAIGAGAQSNTVGGTSAASRNVISGNSTYGAEIKDTGTDLNVVKGNYIGTDPAGSTAVANGTGAIIWAGAANNTIGGNAADEGNIISGSSSNGLIIANGGSDNNVVQGNLIGTDKAGTGDLGNGISGINLNQGALNNTIGGTGTLEGNTIAFNGGDGIVMTSAGTDGNQVSGNSIFENDGLGIDLAPDGVGTGSGANQDKAAPTIDSITSGGSGFTVNATVGSGDIVEFFRVNNAAGPAVTPDGTGSGEGFLYLGRCVDNGACSGPHVDAVADPDVTNGGVEATILSSGLGASDYLTTTAIDSSGNTSEFASNVQAPVPACDGGLVTTTTDSLDPGTLRSCVIWANSNPGDDTITLPAGTYVLTLTGAGEDATLTGDLDIDDVSNGLLTINGAGARTTIIDAAGLGDRIFEVGSGDGSLTLTGMTLQNGNVGSDDGGAIKVSNVTLTLTDVALLDNSADGAGGAISVTSGSAALNANRVLMSGNTADEGGAVHGSGAGALLNITNGTFSDNEATTQGGAFFVVHLALVNVTVFDNTAPATAIGGVVKSGATPYSAINTIIAGNTGGDCSDPIDSGNNNIDSDGTCGFATTADPKLGALANNGGQTDTMMPQSYSPAIEGGTNTFCPAVDQRSIARPDGALCDVGAVEAEIHELTGTVFEDVNYGGGIGRDLATAAADAPSFTVGRGGVTVELYASGNFVTSTATVAGGGYSFTVTPGTYTVRVVNSSVTSSRPGSDGSELAVQTYRIDGVSEAAGDGAKKVGGELPSNEDAAANSGAQTLASLQGTDLDSDSITEWTQSIVTVDASGGDVSGVDFGFNFDVVVNTNDSGQGSLRQFIINSNLLAWLGHGEERLIAAVDSLDRW